VYGGDIGEDIGRAWDGKKVMEQKEDGARILLKRKRDVGFGGSLFKTRRMSFYPAWMTRNETRTQRAEHVS